MRSHDDEPGRAEVRELDQSPGRRAVENLAARGDSRLLGHSERLVHRSLPVGRLSLEPSPVVRLSEDRRQAGANIDEDDISTGFTRASVPKSAAAANEHGTPWRRPVNPATLGACSEPGDMPH
jgi:hypothetical protein